MAFSQEKTVEGVVAVVGKEIILYSEVEGQYEALTAQGGPSLITKCSVLEDQLLEKLLIHHAEIDSVVVGDEEVDNNIDRRIQSLVQQIGSEQRLEEYYKKSIIEIKEEMRPLMRNQLIAQRMQYTITEGIEVTPTEVQQFYNSIPVDSLPLIQTEVELAQIVKFPEVSKEAEKEVIDKLNDLKRRIEEGTGFSTMAILYSEDPGSNKNGGEYKGIKRGQFQKEFEAVAFNLRPGEVSKPFKTIYGYHIVQVQKKRGEELDLRHILIKPKIDQQNLNEAEQFLDSITSMIKNGTITFEEAAERYSEDENSKFNGGMMLNPQTGETKWETGNMDRAIFYAIDGKKANEITKPNFFRQFDGREAFRILKVVSKIEPHRANLRDDYTRLKGMCMEMKQREALDEWIKAKVKETYIKINQDYYNCTFRNTWTVDENTSAE